MARAKKPNSKLSLPQLWMSAKFVAWCEGHVNPIVRVPRPKGGTESKSIVREEGEHEYDLFERCIQYRDRRGAQVWGRRRWAEILDVPVRIVARQPAQPAGPEIGVRHYTRNGTGVWAVYWNERPSRGGVRRQRSRHFTYGGPCSRYATSEEAEAAAIQVRKENGRQGLAGLAGAIVGAAGILALAATGKFLVLALGSILVILPISKLAYQFVMRRQTQ